MSGGGVYNGSSNMGGARNGRALKFLFLVAVLLFCGFLGYQHHLTRTELGGSRRQFEQLRTRHEKLTSEWKDLIQSHALVEKELKEERNLHVKTREGKALSDKKHTEDLRMLREANAKDKSALESDRDEHKAAAQRHEANYNDLLFEHKKAVDICAQESETAADQYQKLQDRCLDSETQLNAKIKQLEDDLSSVRSTRQNNQMLLQQCTTQVDSLKQAAETSQTKVSSLESANKKLESELTSLKQKMQQTGDRRVPPEKNKWTRKPPTSFSDVEVNDRQKRQIYENLKQKIQDGQFLTDKQSQIFQLLQKQFESTIRDAAKQPPDLGRSHPSAKPPKQPSFGDRGQGPPPFVDRGQPAPDMGMRQGWRRAGMEYRPDELPQENDKIPDEPEAEVKDLRFEEAVGQQEFDNLEEDQEGGAQQAFNPLEGQEEENEDDYDDEEEEEDDDYYDDDDDDNDDEEEEKDINEENLPQPQQLGAVPPQKPEQQEWNPDQKQEWNQDQQQEWNQDQKVAQVIDWNKQQALERDPGQNHNLDREYDDFEKNVEEEDDKLEEQYEDEDKEFAKQYAGDRQLREDMADMQRMLARKDAEGKLRKSVEEQDNHRREEKEPQEKNLDHRAMKEIR